VRPLNVKRTWSPALSSFIGTEPKTVPVDGITSSQAQSPVRLQFPARGYPREARAAIRAFVLSSPFSDHKQRAPNGAATGNLDVYRQLELGKKKSRISYRDFLARHGKCAHGTHHTSRSHEGDGKTTHLEKAPAANLSLPQKAHPLGN
jgi:hypothetical protein